MNYTVLSFFFFLFFFSTYQSSSQTITGIELFEEASIDYFESDTVVYQYALHIGSLEEIEADLLIITLESASNIQENNYIIEIPSNEVQEYLGEEDHLEEITGNQEESQIYYDFALGEITKSDYTTITIELLISGSVVESKSLTIE